MPDDDLYSPFFAGVSIIIAVCANLANMRSITTIFSFITGAFVTYFVQARLQDRRRKNQIRIDNIKDIYAPLYLEIVDIRESLLDVPKSLVIKERLNHSQMHYWNNSWVSISYSHHKFTLDTEFNKEVSDFYVNIEELDKDITSISIIINEILVKQFKEYFLKLIDKPGVLYPSSTDPGYRIEFYEKYKRRNISYLYKYILFGVNPIDLLEENEYISLDKCYINFLREVEGTDIREQLQLSEYDSKFKYYLEAVEQIIVEIEEIKRIRLKIKDLSEIAQKFEIKLLSHIDKYYPVENIDDAHKLLSFKR